MELSTAVEGTGPRLVLVHGFSQTRDCWGPVAGDLAVDHEVVRIDAPGHGGSLGPPVGLGDGAGSIAETAGSGTYLGYSMGGRYVLRVAVDRPDVTRGVVLIGATAGIDDGRLRAERAALDAARAERLERDGLDAFLDDWLALPLFARLPEAMRFRATRRENTVEGLAASLREAGTGAQEPLWDRLGSLQVPVLAIAGEHDAKFRAEAQRMAASIGPSATAVVVPGAGHAAHLEQPTGFLAVVRPWLAAHGL